MRLKCSIQRDAPVSFADFITLQNETGDVIDRITGDMRQELENVGIEAEVFGRAKKPYSIWRKMQEKDLSFSPAVRYIRVSRHYRQ